jgi:alkylation response protein AidB-like acyl-CoA dehydrogenase
MIEALKELGKKAEGRREEIENARVLPKDLVQELKQTGILRLWVAKAYDGKESDVISLIDAVQELAYYNGSLAWVACVTGTGSLTSGYLNSSDASDIFSSSEAMLGGFAAPINKAIKVEDGIRISGRWGWGSGTSHCTTVIGGAMIITKESDRPTPAVLLFDPKDVIWHDTWNTNGLKGTGSGDYEVSSVFVPDGRWIPFPVMEAVIDSPLYRVSFNGALAAVVSSVGLGLAKRALDEMKLLAQTKKPVMARKTIAEKPIVQYELAQAEAKYRSAKLFLEKMAVDIYESAKSDNPDIDTKNQFRMASTHAVAQSAEVVNWCYKIGGGSTIWDTEKLQELHRDMAVLTQHGLIASSNNEMIGKVAFGQPFNEWML